MAIDRSLYRRGGARAMGFAKLSIEESRAMSARGGRRAQELGTAYKWNRETARIAGHKGGLIGGRRKRKAV